MYYDFFLLTGDDAGVQIGGRCKSIDTTEGHSTTLREVILHKGVKLRRLEQLRCKSIIVKDTPLILIERDENEAEEETP